MSFTYSGNPSTSPIDEARFILGDTIAAAPIMQDEEIKYLLDEYGDNENAFKYELFSRAANLFARDIKRTLGPQSEDPSSRLNYFANKAASYKAKLAMAGISMQRFSHPQIFKVGMQNNPPYVKHEPSIIGDTKPGGEPIV